MRPGKGNSDKGAPAFTGLRPEIRALSCLWMTLSYSSHWRVAMLGLEWGQGSKKSPGVSVRTGTGAHKGTVVGLVAWKVVVQRERDVQRTGKVVPFIYLFFLTTTPTISPCHVMPSCNLLSNRRIQELKQLDKGRERNLREKKNPLILLSH